MIKNEKFTDVPLRRHKKTNYLVRTSPYLRGFKYINLVNGLERGFRKSL